MASTASTQLGDLSPRARHAVRGAWMGFFVDMFDIYLPIVVLAPAIIYFVSPQMNEATTAIVNGSIFAATLLGRPIGAFIFGHLGDTIGRRRTTIIAVSGFGVATLLIAFLPGYAQWGIAAAVVFILLRFIDGIFLGGEYTAASPLAMEYSPKEKRGFFRRADHDRLPAGVRDHLPDHPDLASIDTGRGSELPLRAVGLEDTVRHRCA